jgi:hypothetical protein
MAGRVPAIHALIPVRPQDVDARDEPGHDVGETMRYFISPFSL